MSQVPDAWDDEWSTAADGHTPTASTEIKKPTAKQTKAQKRAAQAEFNRQLWAEAEGPRETNYFLESRNVVPLRQEYKPPPVLLSRKGPIIQKSRPALDSGMDALHIKGQEDSSEDEDDEATQLTAQEAAKVLAAKEREEKQRKYEERRLELFGPDAASSSARPNSRSGGSSPANLTPPGSRSSTPNRGGKRGRGRGNSTNNNNNPRLNQQPAQQLRSRPQELFDSEYAAKPNAFRLAARGEGNEAPSREMPIREPRAPDGTAGFAAKSRSLVAGAPEFVPGH